MNSYRLAGVLILIAVTERSAEAQPKVDWQAKRLAFEMQKKPWPAVFEWFSRQTGLPFTAAAMPMGTFTFVGPRNRIYSLTETLDIINDVLQAQQKYTLIRHDTGLTLWPADEEVPDRLIPRVHLEDLPQRARSEVVAAVVAFTAGTGPADLDSERSKGIRYPLTDLGDERYIVRGQVSVLLARRHLFTDATVPAPMLLVSPLPPPVACCETVPRCRVAPRARLLRR